MTGTFVPPPIMRQFLDWPQEAAAIGRILAGYGELEFTLYLCLAAALGHEPIAARVLFRTRSEKQRIEMADAVMSEIYTQAGLESEYDEAISNLNFCRKIRNQYAHCHWHYETTNGLFFANLDPPVQKRRGSVILKFYHVDLPLLTHQERFYAFTQSALFWLKETLTQTAGKQTSPPLPKPERTVRPRLYNPAEEHPLPGREPAPGSLSQGLRPRSE